MLRLQAINMLLRMVDQTPISSLTTTNPDIENIVSALDLALEDVNEEGWWYNTDYGVTLPRDSNGFIHVGENFRGMQFSDGLVQRGSRVYDSINNTYMFAEDKTAITRVTLLSWDDTHPHGTKAAAYKAASDFAEAETLSVAQVQTAQRGYARAMIDLRKEHVIVAQPNMFDRSTVQFARSRSGNGRSRFFGTPDH